MMEFLLLLIPFLVRFMPRYFQPDKVDVDTWYHLASAKSIYNNKYRIPKCNEGYLLGGRYDYPYLAHWLVALLTKGKVLKYEKYIAPLLDLLYIFVGLIYFRFLIEFYQLDEVSNKSVNFILLLAFSMSMLKISTGPRVYNFTPRIFGEFFIFITLITLHLYSLDGTWWYLLVAIFFGAFALISSKFAAQVLVLFSIILGILMMSFIPVLILLLSFLMAMLISKGHYKKVFEQQLKHMKQYALYGQYNHPTVQKRNKLSQYLLFFKTLQVKKFKESYIIFQKDLVFINVFYKNIDVVIALGILFFMGIEQDFFSNILWAGLIVFLVTSYKPFQFLGESDRYLDYLVVFSVIIIVLYLPQPYINIILGLEIIFYFFTLLLYFKSSNDFGKEFLLATAYIKKNNNKQEKSVIHGILGMYINYPLYFLTGVNALAIEANYVFNLNKNSKLMPKIMQYTNDFDYLYNEYKVNIIITNKKYLNQDIEYDFSKFNLFYENKKYVVYRRKKY